MRPEGIEPPSQEPESCVISITLRTRMLITQPSYFTEILEKMQE